MTPRQWLLVAALIFALALASLDIGWPWDVDGNRHLPTWLGLSFACFVGSHLVRDR
jgi:hypothetical protein